MPHEHLSKKVGRAISAIAFIPALATLIAVAYPLATIISTILKAGSVGTLQRWVLVLVVAFVIAVLTALFINRYQSFRNIWLHYRLLAALVLLYFFHIPQGAIRNLGRTWGPIWVLSGVLVIPLAINAAILSRSRPLAASLVDQLAETLNEAPLTAQGLPALRDLTSYVALSDCRLALIDPTANLILTKLKEAIDISATTPGKDIDALLLLHYNALEAQLPSSKPGDRSRSNFLISALRAKIHLSDYQAKHNLGTILPDYPVLLSLATQEFEADKNDSHFDQAMWELTQNSLAACEVYFAGKDSYSEYTEWAKGRKQHPLTQTQLLESAEARQSAIKQDDHSSSAAVRRAINNLADLTLVELRIERPATHGRQPSIASTLNAWQEGPKILERRREALLQVLVYEPRAEYMVTLAQISALLAHAYKMELLHAPGGCTEEAMKGLTASLVDTDLYLGMALRCGATVERIEREAVSNELRSILWPVITDSTGAVGNEQVKAVRIWNEESRRIRAELFSVGWSEGANVK